MPVASPSFPSLLQSTKMRPPDILLFISDDHRWLDFGAAGNLEVRTPHLDQLASEGLLCDGHATPTPMCAPARMSLYSGLYPVRHGGYPNHSRAHEGLRSIVHHLGALGYRVGLHGKSHVAPPTVFPFETVADPATFFARDRAQPCCLVVATSQPHTPWLAPTPGSLPPEKLTLWPNLADTPGTRRALSRYYASVEELDDKVGAALAALDQAGRPEETLVIYTSDHGAQFPGGKWTCFEPGLRVPCLVRWPGRVAPGSRTTALTQHVDLLPTLIEAAGGTPETCDTGLPTGQTNERGFDGRSCLSLWLGQKDEHRSHVYGVQTQNRAARSLPYPVRSVRDKRYKYILNPLHEVHYQNILTTIPEAVTENEYWPEWLAAAEGDPSIRHLTERYLHRPPVELYDLEADPWEMRNLANSPALAGIQSTLATQLADWMAQQGDSDAVATEMAANDRTGRPKSGSQT